MDNTKRSELLSLAHMDEQEPEGTGVRAQKNRGISRRIILRSGMGLAVAATGLGTWSALQRSLTHASTSDSIVVQWNTATLQAIRDVKPGPTIVARALAIVHTAMFNAWTCYDSVARATLSGPMKRPRSEQSISNKNQAMSYAAYRVLLDLFPSEASIFSSLMTTLGYNAANTSTDLSTPAGIGNVSAQVLLFFKHNDGSNQLNGYADTSGYAPVNTYNQINDPNRWQPLLLPNGAVQKFTTPHWGNVTPFALTSGSQFRPAGPILYSSSGYKDQVDQILQYSANLNDTTKTIAEYWADGPHTEFPPGHWTLFAQFVAAQTISRRRNNDLNADGKLFFVLSNALFDASIAAWDCKRAYDSIRPISAVHYLYTGQQVSAWAGPGLGTGMIDGGQWTPYQQPSVITPPFPEYVSGHSTFSAAGAYIFQQFTGSDAFGDSYTQPAGTSRVEPGIVPATDVTLSWATFSAAAVEAAMSRRYGGIHFQQGDLDGRTLGKNVGTQVWTKAQAFINGKNA